MLMASALAALVGCGDHLTDPDDLIESAEAEAVMQSAAALPLLPRFIDTAGELPAPARASLLQARELWDTGSSLDDSSGAASRRLAVDHALPVLVRSVDAEEWAASSESLEEWVATARSMLRHLAVPDVEARLRAADRQLQRAETATTERNRAYHLLLAGSELVETTPRYVARTMARDAETAVRRASDGVEPSVPAATLRRAERLKDWAGRAVEEGDYLLAIQRAYYAIQLVEER